MRAQTCWPHRGPTGPWSGVCPDVGVGPAFQTIVDGADLRIIWLPWAMNRVHPRFRLGEWSNDYVKVIFSPEGFLQGRGGEAISSPMTLAGAGCVDARSSQYGHGQSNSHGAMVKKVGRAAVSGQIMEIGVVQYSGVQCRCRLTARSCGLSNI